MAMASEGARPAWAAGVKAAPLLPSQSNQKSRIVSSRPQHLCAARLRNKCHSKSHHPCPPPRPAPPRPSSHLGCGAAALEAQRSARRLPETRAARSVRGPGAARHPRRLRRQTGLELAEGLVRARRGFWANKQPARSNEDGVAQGWEVAKMRYVSTHSPTTEAWKILQKSLQPKTLGSDLPAAQKRREGP